MLHNTFCQFERSSSSSNISYLIKSNVVHPKEGKGKWMYAFKRIILCETFSLCSCYKVFMRLGGLIHPIIGISNQRTRWSWDRPGYSNYLLKTYLLAAKHLFCNFVANRTHATPLYPPHQRNFCSQYLVQLKVAVF